MQSQSIVYLPIKILETHNTPTIKGIFVASHINNLRKIKGEAGVRQLEEKFGKRLIFSKYENVPIHEEVKILEICVKILNPKLPQEKLSFEAGRLHFKNFATTPLAKIIFSVFRKQFKTLMLSSHMIAEHVFSGVKFKSKDKGKNKVSLIMKNNDYPLDHFKGLIYEWMRFAGLNGKIKAQRNNQNTYEYNMEWE